MSNEYYETLFVMDRIEDLAVRKFVTLSNFGRKFGKSPAWAYNALCNGSNFKIKKINEIAKLLDVNLEYLFTGKNKQPYNGAIDTQKVIDNIPPKHKNILKEELTLSTLLNVLRITKKNINDFITGE